METAEAEADAVGLPALKVTQQRLPAATEQVRVKLDTIQAVIDHCQRALSLLEVPQGLIVNTDPEVNVCAEEKETQPLSFPADDSDADVLCEMVKSKIDSQSFLEKLGCVNLSVSQSDFAWDMIDASDLWDSKQFEPESKECQDGYVLVNHEDIVEGITSFMAAYLLSLKEAKELTPNQLQEVLRKTFSAKKKKSKLRKAWEGSQVIYNVASWGATAFGIYQNPAIINVAAVAFLSSCRVVSKFF